MPPEVPAETQVDDARLVVPLPGEIEQICDAFGDVASIEGGPHHRDVGFWRNAGILVVRRARAASRGNPRHVRAVPDRVRRRGGAAERFTGRGGGLVVVADDAAPATLPSKTRMRDVDARIDDADQDAGPRRLDVRA